MLPGSKMKFYHSTSLKAGDKIFFRIYKSGKGSLEDGEIVNRIGRMFYKIQGRNWSHKIYLKKLQQYMTMK